MDIRKKQRAVVNALENVKGRDIVVYNVTHLSPIFERVVIASGDSTRQVRALADNVARELKSAGARVYGVEGHGGSEWVLVDLGDIIVHVMHPTMRAHYNLEEIWGGKEVRLKVAAPARPAKRAKPVKSARPAKRAKAPARRRRG